MRGVQLSLVLLICITLGWGVIGCSSGGGGGEGGGGGAGQTDADQGETEDNTGGQTDPDGGQTGQNGDTDDESSPDEADNDTTESSELTEAEQNAVAAGYQASQSMMLATTASQGATDPDNLTGDTLTGQTVPGCPEITAGAQSFAGLELTVGADYGDGCTPAWVGDSGVTVSGSATLAVSQSEGTADATFTDLTIAEDDVSLTLDGTANVTYDQTGDEIALTGEWDLSLTTPDEVVTTDGNGTCTYDILDDVAAIPTFTGEVAIDPDTWRVAIEDLAASYAAYGSYIPYTGSIVLTGPDIGTLTVQFSESSPTTGNVTVKVNNAPAITVNIYTLMGY